MDSWHLDLFWVQVSWEEHALCVVVARSGLVVAEFVAQAVAVVVRVVFAAEELEVVVAASVAVTAESQPCSFELEEASSEAYFASSAALAIVARQVAVDELAFVAKVTDYSQRYSLVRRRHCVLGVAWLDNTLADSCLCGSRPHDTRF